MTRVPTSWCHCRGIKTTWSLKERQSLHLLSEDIQKSGDSRFAILFVLATPLSNPTGRWLHWERNLTLKIIYTRRFLDLDPQKVVDNHERILRRSSTPVDKGISHLQRASSLPTESVKYLMSLILIRKLISPSQDLDMKLSCVKSWLVQRGQIHSDLLSSLLILHPLLLYKIPQHILLLSFPLQFLLIQLFSLTQL